ncbi:MAG TPA: DoxX family protein [Acidobacteriota bacterium]|nr:DoxX family protein [Acidobacteriota bacterium]
MTLQSLSQLATPLYTLMRFAFGLLFWFHGAQKLFGWFGGQKVELASQMGLAGIIEFVGGLAIALGLFTRIVALICALEMAAAYLIAHAGQAPFPIQNGGELALLYLFAFLYFMAHGAGRWSTDVYIQGSRMKRNAY